MRRLRMVIGAPQQRHTSVGRCVFQLHLVDAGTSAITVNATLTRLRFFFEVTLDRSDVMSKLQPVPMPRKLPVVLSRDEGSAASERLPVFAGAIARTVVPLLHGVGNL
jgi:hypothetical protein